MDDPIMLLISNHFHDSYPLLSIIINHQLYINSPSITTQSYIPLTIIIIQPLLSIIINQSSTHHHHPPLTLHHSRVFPKSPEVDLQQKEGHPAVRVFDQPLEDVKQRSTVRGVPPVGPRELGLSEAALLAAKSQLLLRNTRQNCWLTTKNINNLISNN